MDNTEWIIFDTETTGIKKPIFAVELAAQKMLGWKPVGEPFQRLLNHNAYVPSEATRVNGYTREILERDGNPPLAVYRDFETYVNNSPVVSYNLEYDLDKVLIPEWKRLGIKRIGKSGFCAYRLAKRLLDPIPAGNCKLQTLRQYYRLPERGAHTALGDVQTVVDLMSNILRPLVEQRNLASLADIRKFTEDEWFPLLIPFGKFKGRDYREAFDDNDLYNYLEWLCKSSNSRSRAMGIWYLDKLEKLDTEFNQLLNSFPAEHINVNNDTKRVSSVKPYVNPETASLKELIAITKKRLAEHEAIFTNDRSDIEAMQAMLYNQLKTVYQRREKLTLIVKYRHKYIKHLVEFGDAKARKIVDEFKEALGRSDNDYEKADQVTSNLNELNPDEKSELMLLWKKLVSIYHPDRFNNDPILKQNYENLTAIINEAKQNANVNLLREIAADVNAFMLENGCVNLYSSANADISALRVLYRSLQIKLNELINRINELRESPNYELLRLVKINSSFIDELVTERKKIIMDDIRLLEMEAEILRCEIVKLKGVEQIII